MPAKSKSQQRFFGVVKGIQKGSGKGGGKAKKAAKAEAHDKAFRLARQKEYCAGQGLGMAPDGKCIGKNIVGGAKQEA